jgi:hypothetical protein
MESDITYALSVFSGDSVLGHVEIEKWLKVQVVLGNRRSQ